jgi:hypothetical protein
MLDALIENFSEAMLLWYRVISSSHSTPSTDATFDLGLKLLSANQAHTKITRVREQANQLQRMAVRAGHQTRIAIADSTNFRKR